MHYYTEIFLFHFAVVKQKYEVQVYDEYVISGNTAVLRCQVPSYVTEYIMVTSWIQDGIINIYPNTDTGRFFHSLFLNLILS